MTAEARQRDASSETFIRYATMLMKVEKTRARLFKDIQGMVGVQVQGGVTYTRPLKTTQCVICVPYCAVLCCEEEARKKRPSTVTCASDAESALGSARPHAPPVPDPQQLAWQCQWAKPW
jgi:hypothetical protein